MGYEYTHTHMLSSDLSPTISRRDGPSVRSHDDILGGDEDAFNKQIAGMLILGIHSGFPFFIYYCSDDTT